MEMRRFIRPALELSPVRQHVFATFSSTRPNNPNNLSKLNYSQRLPAIDTTNAKLTTHILVRHWTNLKLDKNFSFFHCLGLSIYL